MCRQESDALVIFGVTGDLAHRKILPSLYSMERRGVLNVPVVGIVKGIDDFSLQVRVEELHVYSQAFGVPPNLLVDLVQRGLQQLVTAGSWKEKNKLFRMDSL